MIRLGFLGAGNMATAMISGIVKSDIPVSICAYDLDFQKCRALSNYGVHAVDSPQNLVQDSEYLILAVKPQNFEIRTKKKLYLFRLLPGLRLRISQKHWVLKQKWYRQCRIHLFCLVKAQRRCRVLLRFQMKNFLLYAAFLIAQVSRKSSRMIK